MKKTVYVVTSLVEDLDEFENVASEVNVIGIKNNKQEAWLLVSQLVQEIKSNYEENDISYDIKSFDESVVIGTVIERLTIEYHESEVEL